MRPTKRSLEGTPDLEERAKRSLDPLVAAGLSDASEITVDLLRSLKSNIIALVREVAEPLREQINFVEGQLEMMGGCADQAADRADAAEAERDRLRGVLEKIAAGRDEVSDEYMEALRQLVGEDEEDLEIVDGPAW